MISGGHNITGRRLYEALNKLPLEFRRGPLTKVCPAGQEATGVTAFADLLADAGFTDYNQGVSLHIRHQVQWKGPIPRDNYMVTVERLPVQSTAKKLDIVSVTIDRNGNGKRDPGDSGNFTLLKQLMHQAHRFAKNPKAFQRMHCVPEKSK